MAPGQRRGRSNASNSSSSMGRRGNSSSAANGKRVSTGSSSSTISSSQTHPQPSIDAVTFLLPTPDPSNTMTEVARRPSGSLVAARRPSATPSLLSNASMPAPTKPSTAERNIDNVVFGHVLFRAWYPSPYVKDIVGKEVIEEVRKRGPDGKPAVGELMLERLFVCQWCFGYCRDLADAMAHRRVCAMQGRAPGRRIYTHPSPKVPGEKAGSSVWSVWEVDGEVDTLYCQCLSLFAKLFLDNKSVFFDVTNFHYYLLVHTTPASSSNPETQDQVVGFFSKEKMSWDNNNLACILIFPPWQRKSLGLLLIAVSYEISRREQVLGGPEKPISDLGKKGYLLYWTREIARWILAFKLRERDVKKGITVSIEDISRGTWIAVDDCVCALREMGVAVGEAEETSSEEATAGKVKVDKAAVRQWTERVNAALEPVIDPNGFLEGYGFRPDPDDDIEE